MPPLNADIAERYRRFAALEARGASPLYGELALGVADDRELLDLLATLSTGRQQPNLFFAAARWVAGTPATFAAFREAVLADRDAVVATMRSRLTQTNEPARCAALYPLLGALPQPLALIEVGASAGLCLLPDRYRYDYDGIVAGADAPLTLRCRADGGLPAPPGRIAVAWRAGIDLNPLDVTAADDVRWLEALVWPEQHDRLARLRAAVAIARQDRPRILRGDLNDLLPAVAAQAPAGATLVVFHTAVLNYLPLDGRAAFAAQVAGLPGHWIAQEAPGVVPGVAVPPAPTGPGPAPFVLSIDGRPVAWTAPLGGWLHWLSDTRTADAGG